MSAAHCPVCHKPKAESWHLVCAHCWSLIPTADQAEVVALNKKASGSPAHVSKCRKIVRGLHRLRQERRRQTEKRRTA
jgi:hypothetical protein